MAEILFEKLNIPDIYVGITAVCALFAFGKTTGVVLDAGHSVIYSVPIFEGFALPHAINKIDYGGKELSEWLKEGIIKKFPDYDEGLLDWKAV